MESQPFVSLSATDGSPLTTNPSGSASFAIEAPPSYDSGHDSLVLESNNKKTKSSNTSNSSSSYSSGGSDDEGFVSGGEEFETASERPSLADPDDETLEYNTPFAGSSNFPNNIMPVAKLSLDDDGEIEFSTEGKYVVGDSKLVDVVDEDRVVLVKGPSHFVDEFGPGSAELKPAEASFSFPNLSEDKDSVVVGFERSVEKKGDSVVGEANDAVSLESRSSTEIGELKPAEAGFLQPNLTENKDSVVVGVEGSVEKKADSAIGEANEVSVKVVSLESASSTQSGEGGRFGVKEEEAMERNKAEESMKLNKGTYMVGASHALADDEMNLSEVKNGEAEGGKTEPLKGIFSNITSFFGGEDAASKPKDVRGENALGGENKLDESGENKLDESAVLGGNKDQVGLAVLEPEASEPHEVNGKKSAVESYSTIEAPGVALLDIHAASVEDVKGENDLETTKVVLGEGAEGQIIKSDQTNLLAEEFVGLKSTGADVENGEITKTAGDDSTITPDMDAAGFKHVVPGVDLGKVSNAGGLDVHSVTGENKNAVEANGVGNGEAVILTDTTKSVEEIEPKANSEALGDENILKVAADEAEAVTSGQVDATEKTQEVTYNTATRTSPEKEANVSDDGVSGKSVPAEPADLGLPVNREIEGDGEDEDEAIQHADEVVEIEGSVTHDENEDTVFANSEAARQFIEELEQGAGGGSLSNVERFQRIDGQIVTDTDEEVDTEEEGEGKELFDSAALAALLKAASGAGSDGGSITITSHDGSRLFSVERPAGLGSSMRSTKPASRPNHSSLFAPSTLATGGESENNLSDEEKKKLEKIQMLRVKFLRLVQRLGHSPEDSIAAQVLYRLALLAGRQNSQLYSLDSAKTTALQLEEEGKDDLHFSINILVLGKTGVGKSATINSIFGEEKALIDAFEPATIGVKEISGVVDGVTIRVFDTPGLKSSVMEQAFNRKVLASVKKITKKCPPDIVLYVDRLDTQTRDLNDLPLLRSITSSLGSSIWRSVIVTLTHAATAPPDGPSGSSLSYEVYVAQRSHVVQQSIGQAVGDLRHMNPSLMNPVSLVENHPSCRKNREGQKVLPNGQTWRPQLLLLSYSMKILAEATALSKTQDLFDHRKLFGFRVRSPPLPYLLSSLLQPRAHPKLSSDQGGEAGDSDIDLGDLSESDGEEDEDEYDQLPPFKPLRKSQIAKLSKEQKKAYFEEYDYRVRLLQKKQWREELKRMRELRKKGKDVTDDYGYMGDDMDQEDGAPAAVPVPLPDMVLPPSFDGDNPAYRYRFLEPTSQFLARPVLDTHGWDHDCGYDGVNVEQSLAIAGRFPTAVTVQVTKDKKEFNIHLDSSASAKHGVDGSSMLGFDIQTIGKQLAYILRGETKFRNLKKNKTAAGASVTFLGENVATGFKVEDQIALGKRVVLMGSTGTVRSQSDAAYGANVEVRLRERDFPIGQDQSTLALSLMKWRGDLALGANLQSQFSVGRNSKMAVRVALNNKLSGQITVKTSSSDQLQLALAGILPIAMAIYKTLCPGTSENYSIY
ncbi:AIG1-type guanine nucleotide-binding (G) domain [Dillenia turbinata]|uniref:AIG1-type guanine nucleotide-binding (G) domain n=1 Tax=Dillenia turbinata TaxID=194707 RepID=A0AAN8ZE70_9MAGN